MTRKLASAVKRESESDWGLECPNCKRVGSYQTRYVVEVRDPQFKCRFCDYNKAAVFGPGRSR